MLQQTQVSRVEARMDAWLARFPRVEALAAAAVPDVLAAWQGMGYNRRALMLHKTAQIVTDVYHGEFPRDTLALKQLPGIGAATAQGIRSFAFNLPGVYLETNVRTVFLHHFFPDVPAVPDRELIPFIEATCPAAAECGCARSASDEASPYAAPQDVDDTPRNWYYALLDYGAYLKKTIPNPSRRSASYARQSRFEGSRRQKRAEIVRILLGAGSGTDGGAAAEAGSASAAAECVGGVTAAGVRAGVRLHDGSADGMGRSATLGLSLGEVTALLNAEERAAGRESVDCALVASILNDLEREGFCSSCVENGVTKWSI